MEEIIDTVLLEYGKSTFILELVKYQNNIKYVQIQQIIHNQENDGIINKLKINASILSDIIEVLSNYQKELAKQPNIDVTYFSEERKKEIIKRYFKGVSIPDLALQFDCSNNIIEQIIRNQGIEIIDNKRPKAQKYFKKRWRN